MSDRFDTYLAIHQIFPSISSSSILDAIHQYFPPSINCAIRYVLYFKGVKWKGMIDLHTTTVVVGILLDKLTVHGSIQLHFLLIDK